MPPELPDRIEANPDIMGGKPVIRGTRIPVALVLDKLGAGMTPEAIIRRLPATDARRYSRSTRICRRLLLLALRAPSEMGV